MKVRWAITWMNLKTIPVSERSKIQKATYYIIPFIHVFYFFNFILFLKLYIIVLVLPNIKMNPPQVKNDAKAETPVLWPPHAKS